MLNNRQQREVAVAKLRSSSSWSQREAFAVVALREGADSLASAHYETFELAGIYKDEKKASAASLNIKGWYGAPSKVVPIQILTDGKRVIPLFISQKLTFGRLRKRISLGNNSRMKIS